MIYIEKIDAMIEGLQSKNIQEIVDKQIYIPTLDRVNNISQVQNWLNKRINYLEQAKNLSDNQLEILKTNWYNGLTTEQQSQADLLFIGSDVENQTEEDWEATVLARIYYYITTP